MTDTSARNLADAQEIRDLQVAYAYAIDGGAYDDLERIFTTDAVGDYDRAGRVEGVAAIKALCRQALEPLTAVQHFYANQLVNIDGDTASASCYLVVHMCRENTPGGDHLQMGGRYDDKLVRTAAGWRIRHRKLTLLWSDGNPDVRW
jgi:ketosteroid isomerase-like protein